VAQNELVEQSKDFAKHYFRSAGFANAMVMNVSIFFAFMGLLKLYHAVREDLQWCRPWPKFLTIKAVVFLTFWQGLAILLYLIATADDDQKEEAVFEAHKYQNMLICVEMLLVAISQWVSVVFCFCGVMGFVCATDCSLFVSSRIRSSRTMLCFLRLWR
jgi:hypothetical protein